MTRDDLLKILLESDAIQGTDGVPSLTEEQLKFRHDSGIPVVEALKKLVFKKMDDAALAPVTILKEVNVVIEEQAKALKS
jgi:hypothetical protein